MALQYHLVQKNDMRKGAAPGAKLYYGQVRVNNRIKYTELCTHIAEYTLATDADVACIIDALLVVMRQELVKGNIIQLGIVGNFRVTTGAPGVKYAADFHTGMFRKGSIRYFPGTMLRDLTQKVNFEHIRFVKKIIKCNEPHLS